MDHTTLGSSSGAIFPRATPCLRALSPTAAPLKLRDLICALPALWAEPQSGASFREDLARYFGIRHVFLLSSGKAALTIALEALGTLSERREVIIPAFSSFCLPSAVARAGMKIRLCDILPETLDFDLQRLREAVTDQTLCVIPVHLFGLISQVDEIAKLARERGAFILEDAAQAAGGLLQGRPVGTLGDIGIFSLGRGKNMTASAGGVIVTHSDAMADAIAGRLRVRSLERQRAGYSAWLKAAALTAFLRPRLYWLPEQIPSLNLGASEFDPCFDVAPFSRLQAGLGRSSLRRLDEYNQIRRVHAQQLKRGLEHTPGLKLPHTVADSTPVYLRFPMLVEDPLRREAMHATLARHHLGVSKTYPSSLNGIWELASYAVRNESAYPGAESVAQKILTLPTHPFVSQLDLDRIVALIQAESAERSRPKIAPTQVLYIDHTPTHGGSVESLARVVKALDRRQFQPVIVLAHPMEGKSPFVNTPLDVVPYRLPLSIVFPAVQRVILRTKTRSTLLATLMSGVCFVADVFFSELPRFVRLYRIARRYRVGLVHLNNTSYDLAGILTAKLIGAPCVCHHRDFKVISPILRWQARLIDWHIAISDAIRQDVLRLGVEPERISVVFDSIDPEMHDPDVDIRYLVREFDKQPGEKFFGIFGRVVDWKGQDFFLRAAAIVLESVPRSRAFIVGDDADGTSDYLQSLQTLVQQLGIASKVVFTGFRRDAAMMMKLMDVVVHASTRPEPFGMVVIEAMAMHRPVVATIGGGPSEVIQDGVNGVLVPPRDVGRMAQEIRDLLLDERQAGRLGAQGVLRAAQFRSDAAAGAIERIYKGLLSHRSGEWTAEGGSGFKGTSDVE